MKYKRRITSVLVQRIRLFICTNTMNKKIQELNIFIKTTAECEHGFSLMNIYVQIYDPN